MMYSVIKIRSSGWFIQRSEGDKKEVTAKWGKKGPLKMNFDSISMRFYFLLST